MRILQICLPHAPSPADLAPLAAIEPHLVLVFGAVARFSEPALPAALSVAFPHAELAGCTTAGEISQDGVTDGHVVITALHFDQPALQVAVTDLDGMSDSQAAGARLAHQLTASGLHNVLVLGQGVGINGSALIDGMQAALPAGVILSGGLAGDGGAFSQSFILSRHGVSCRHVMAVGFSSPRTRFAHGCFHGWEPFGPARKVTRASGNILYELDGQPALDIYKRYLGDHARDLPGSGLLFPFEMLGDHQDGVGLIRTILGIDEAMGSLVLAGDIVEHGYLKLMHSSTDALVAGAQRAAEAAIHGRTDGDSSLALLVSCVGRKLVMGARVDEEVEAVGDVFGPLACVTGFYSNGEISPAGTGVECRLHNQTMTITYISEAAA
jgi:hypothetical protein